VIIGKELFCYRNKGDIAHRVMHSLVGTFIKDMPQVFDLNKKVLFPVKISLPPNKSRILFFDSQELQTEWVQSLKVINGYTNLFDFYDFEKDLGQGQFGLVKLARHKETGDLVAIKTVYKKNMKPIEIFQQRREIEVLKMCQHPNIVGLIDLFENNDYYYIVLEYMQGGDLFDYNEQRNFKMSEDRVKQIAYQLGQAIKYLHNYGIVHRDLKLENVMMSDSLAKSVPKLVDFGLAKMIGPNETANEPFGTLGYVAPEVLKKEPYSYSCDVWSWGCIIFAMISGCLPFDHDNQKEAIRMTFECELDF
jgi:serine/threonine protein kinase